MNASHNPCSWRRIALLVAVLACLIAGAWPKVAAAEPSIISVPNTADVVYDDQRSLLYISAASSVLRYDPVGAKMLAPLELGGSLAGMDLSPDGRTLAVADTTQVGSTNRIHLVDLDSASEKTVSFTRETSEGGTWQVAYGYDGRLLVSSAYGGTSRTPIRRYDPATGQSVVIAHPGDSTPMAPSGDRTLVGFLDSYEFSPGFVYRVSDGAILPRGSYNYEDEYDVTLSRDGGQFGLVTSSELTIWSESGKRTIANPCGAKFSPNADLLYVPIKNTKTVAVYDTANLTEVARHDLGTPLKPENTYRHTRLAVPVDDGALFATVEAGVSAVPIKPSVRGSVVSERNDVPVEGARVELWRSTPGGWVLEGSRTTGTAGTFSYTTANTAPIRVRVVDPNGVAGPKWFGGDSLATATSLVPGVSLTSPAVVRLPLVSGGSIEGIVTSSWDDSPVVGVTVELFEGTRATPIAATTTAAGGRYTFSGLPSGRYRVKFTDPSLAHKSAYGGGGARAIDSQLVRLNEAAQTIELDQELEFIPFVFKGSVRSTFLFWPPVSGATLEFWRDGDVFSPSEVAVAATDVSGGWTFRTADASPTRIRVVDPSGMHAPRWYAEPSGSTEDTAAAMQVVPLRVGAPASVDMRLPLISPGSIRGTVRGSSRGQAVAGVAVRAYLDTPGTPVIADATTDANGEFTILGLGRAAYRILFSDASGTHQSEYYKDQSTLDLATPIPVSTPVPTSITATLTTIPTVMSGTVTSSFAGVAVAGAKVEVWRNGPGGWARETTRTASSTGVWTYSTDTTEPVRLRVTDPRGMHDARWLGGTSVEDAQDYAPARGTPTVVNSTLTLSNPGALEVTVTSRTTGAPVGGAVLRLRRLTGDGGAVNLPQRVTDASGKYRFEGLGPSSYVLYILDPSGAHDASGDVGPFVVDDAETLTCAKSLASINPWFRGTVRSSRFGMPVPGAKVEVWRPNGLGSWGVETTITAAADGRWSYTTLSTAPACFRVSDPAEMHASRWIGGDELDSATRFEPGWAAGSGADAVIPIVAAASIEGVVRSDLHLRPLGGVEVTLFGPDGTELLAATTGIEGRYSFRDLPPGAYRIYFNDPSGRHLSEYWNAADYLSEATPVRVVRPERIEVSPYLLSFDDSWGLEFSGTRLDPQSTSNPYVGQPVKLQTSLFETQSGLPIDDTVVTLQYSTDGTTWLTSSAPVVNTSIGQYEATVIATAPGIRRYRFTVPFDEWYTFVQPSAVLAVDAHSGTTSWRGPYLGSAQKPLSCTSGYRQLVRIQAVLTGWGGKPIDGAKVVLQERTSSGSWVNTPGAVIENLYGGTYRTNAATDRSKAYRLTSQQVGYDAGSSSPTGIVKPAWSVSTPTGKTLSRNKLRVRTVVKPALSSQPRTEIEVYKRGKWKRISPPKTQTRKAYGTYVDFQTTFKVASGTYRVRTYVPGTGSNNATYSAKRVIKHRP